MNDYKPGDHVTADGYGYPDPTVFTVLSGPWKPFGYLKETHWFLQSDNGAVLLSEDFLTLVPEAKPPYPPGTVRYLAGGQGTYVKQHDGRWFVAYTLQLADRQDDEYYRSGGMVE